MVCVLFIIPMPHELIFWDGKVASIVGRDLIANLSFLLRCHIKKRIGQYPANTHLKMQVVSRGIPRAAYIPDHLPGGHGLSR